MGKEIFFYGQVLQGSGVALGLDVCACITKWDLHINDTLAFIRLAVIRGLYPFF